MAADKITSVATSSDLRHAVENWRANGETVALVPTMGALHAGHLALVEAARRRCRRVVVSIFVNPTQFGPAEDFERYPRDTERDLALLREERVDAVYVAYAQFVSTTLQRAVVEPLLPVVPAELRAQEAVGYIYEPTSLTVLSGLLPRFVEMQLYHQVLEAAASEQSARMVAMRNATDNANEMAEDLTLVMNKVRQAAITTELLDIVGGAAAVQA